MQINYITAQILCPSFGLQLPKQVHRPLFGSTTKDMSNVPPKWTLCLVVNKRAFENQFAVIFNRKPFFQFINGHHGRGQDGIECFAFGDLFSDDVHLEIPTHSVHDIGDHI